MINSRDVVFVFVQWLRVQARTQGERMVRQQPLHETLCAYMHTARAGEFDPVVPWTGVCRIPSTASSRG